MPSLGDEYPREQKRLRQLLTQYKEIGPAGQFGYIMISDVLDRANTAAISGDVVEMVRVFNEMKECQ
jgi:hypothetical protein